MTKLSTLQNEFAIAAAKLILWCDNNGLVVTLGDAYRDPRVFGPVGSTPRGIYGEPNSCHKSRLAIDLNLIIDGKLAKPEQYAPMHDYWDTLGGSKRIANDMNHFSFAYNGMR